jgi:hypothetical protein
MAATRRQCGPRRPLRSGADGRQRTGRARRHSSSGSIEAEGHGSRLGAGFGEGPPGRGVGVGGGHPPGGGAAAHRQDGRVCCARRLVSAWAGGGDRYPAGGGRQDRTGPIEGRHGVCLRPARDDPEVHRLPVGPSAWVRCRAGGNGTRRLAGRCRGRPQQHRERRLLDRHDQVGRPCLPPRFSPGGSSDLASDPVGGRADRSRAGHAPTTARTARVGPRTVRAGQSRPETARFRLGRRGPHVRLPRGPRAAGNVRLPAIGGVPTGHVPRGQGTRSGSSAQHRFRKHSLRWWQRSSRT